MSTAADGWSRRDISPPPKSDEPHSTEAARASSAFMVATWLAAAGCHAQPGAAGCLVAAGRCASRGACQQAAEHGDDEAAQGRQVVAAFLDGDDRPERPD